MGEARLWVQSGCGMSACVCASWDLGVIGAASAGTGIHIPAQVTGASVSCQGGIFREGEVRGPQPDAGGQPVFPS